MNIINLCGCPLHSAHPNSRHNKQWYDDIRYDKSKQIDPKYNSTTDRCGMTKVNKYN